MGLKATRGKKYQISKIYAHHFLDTAASVDFSTEQMHKILDDIQVELPEAIERLQARLPADFPMEVSSAIFEHSLKMVKKLSITGS